MPRTTDAKVRDIIEVDPSITNLAPFITAAHGMVEEHCKGISELAAEDVETWLAAHLITIRDNRASSEQAKGVGQSFQFKIDLGLSCSMYGQTAMALDPTGMLARWNALILSGKATQKASVVWLGVKR